jgi:hypothetical protein
MAKIGPIEQFASELQQLRRDVSEIAADVKSLLATRSFTRGVWRAVGVIGGLAGAIAALAVSVAQHFWPR